MQDNNFENEKDLFEEEKVNEPEEINETEQYIDITIDSIEEEKPKKTLLREVLDWVMSIALALILVMVLNMFVFVQVVVDGSSMYPTLKDGDRLIASRFLYTPKVGDIVVVEPYLESGTVKGKLMFGRTLYIKRVVANEGQTIDLKDGKVYIDGNLLEEEYIADSVKTFAYSTKLPQTVPEGHVFVMGDNRENSRDSRDATVGMVSYEKVVGKAVLRLLPAKSFGVLK